jgi:hypothetical protein
MPSNDLIHPQTYKDSASPAVAQSFPVSVVGSFNTVKEVAPEPNNDSFELWIAGVIFSNSTAAAGGFKLQSDTGGTPVDLHEFFEVGANSTLVVNFPQYMKVPAGKNVGCLSDTDAALDTCTLFGRVNKVLG